MQPTRRSRGQSPGELDVIQDEAQVESSPNGGADGDEGRPTVLFVLTQTGDRADGGIRSISKIIENADRIRPVVLTQAETPIVGRWRELGIPVQVEGWDTPTAAPSGTLGGALRKSTRAASILRFNLRVPSIVDEVGADVVHLNDIGAAMHTVGGASLTQVPVVHNIRDVKEVEGYDLRWKVIERMSDLTIVLSDDMARRVADGLDVGDRDRIRRIYSAIEFDRIDERFRRPRKEVRDELGIPSETRALLYVGSVCRKKAQLAFIRSAIDRLNDQAEGWQLYFLGDFEPGQNEYARRCRDEVERLGLSDRVHFMGYRDDVFDWYHAADLTLLASRREGMARSMIESLAFGTPVISFAVSSAREILEGHSCGRVVGKGDHAGFVDAVASLLKDPETRQGMGQRGRGAARDLFELPDIVRQYEDTYIDLVG